MHIAQWSALHNTILQTITSLVLVIVPSVYILIPVQYRYPQYKLSSVLTTVNQAEKLRVTTHIVTFLLFQVVEIKIIITNHNIILYTIPLTILMPACTALLQIVQGCQVVQLTSVEWMNLNAEPSVNKCQDLESTTSASFTYSIHSTATRCALIIVFVNLSCKRWVIVINWYCKMNEVLKSEVRNIWKWVFIELQKMWSCFCELCSKIGLLYFLPPISTYHYVPCYCYRPVSIKDCSRCTKPKFDALRCVHTLPKRSCVTGMSSNQHNGLYLKLNITKTVYTAADK